MIRADSRDARYCLVIAVLGVMVILSGMRIKDLDAALAAKPKTVTQIETKTKTQVVAGPERIVEKLVKGDVVERIVYRDPVTTTTSSEKELDRSVSPACPDVNGNRWIAGLGVNPLHASDFPALRGGYSWGNRFDLAASFTPRNTSASIEANLRFK